MYLKVVNGTKSKEYTLTSQYNEKPYMIVSGANKLPLTTKPPLDYISSSESRSFYTTAENPDNLRETTALTRQSTYETVYETRASTYNTIYGTRQDISQWSYHTKDGYSKWYENITRYVNGSPTLLYGNPVYISHIDDDSWDSWTATLQYAYDFNPSGLKPTGYKTVTTGTTYLTRASTSSTLYLTRSSTSGYQGISSTSSSTSYNTSPGVNAYIKIIDGTKTLRPLEYKLSSESASMYTTVSPDKWYLISSTTALTRSSTSQTIYNTRASTYNIIYGTRQDISQWSYHTKDDYSRWCSNITRYVNGSPTVFYGNPLYITLVDDGTWDDWTATSRNVWHFNPSGLTPTGYKTVTTGTTYLTRASTYQTIYQTRESTSAYSGVSSSSQSAMVWV